MGVQLCSPLVFTVFSDEALKKNGMVTLATLCNEDLRKSHLAMMEIELESGPFGRQED